MNKEETYQIHSALYELKVLNIPQVSKIVEQIENEVGMRNQIQTNFGDIAFN